MLNIKLLGALSNIKDNLFELKLHLYGEGFFTEYTWFVRNVLITIAVYGFCCYELDPVLDLGNPGIHAVTGTLAAIADHSDLGESKL